MFVSKTRFILKTCGTTLLLEALEELFRLAKKFCKFEVEVSETFALHKFPLFRWAPRQDGESERRGSLHPTGPSCDCRPVSILDFNIHITST